MRSQYAVFRRQVFIPQQQLLIHQPGDVCQYTCPVVILHLACPSSRVPRLSNLTIRAAGVEPLKLPAQSPKLNAFAERWVRSVKQECLGKLILFGEGSLKRALTEFLEHYHAERPHQGKDNVLLFPTRDQRPVANGRVGCNARLGGLLRYYFRAA